jgi:TPR repeat protein
MMRKSGAAALCLGLLTIAMPVRAALVVSLPDHAPSGAPPCDVAFYRHPARAAEPQNPAAQYALGLMYELGQGVAQDYGAAVRWYRRAAVQGFAEAQNQLGLALARGLGVARDQAEPMRWLQLAAKQGVAAAQFNIGVLYFTGRLVRQDYAEALKWYHRAAEQGLATALDNLGFMYFRGRGTAPDIVEAHKWFQLGAALGDGDADRSLATVEKAMTAAQIADARHRARQWIERRSDAVRLERDAEAPPHGAAELSRCF